MKRRSVRNDPINDVERERGIVVVVALDLDKAVPVDGTTQPNLTPARANGRRK
jgi:hypothetical protein